MTTWIAALPAAAALGGVGEAPAGGLLHHSDGDLPLVHERDHDRELAVLASEAACAVDRIDDPEPGTGVCGLGQRLRSFLGAEGIAGEESVQMGQDDLLRLAIRFRGNVRRRVGDRLEVGVLLEDGLAGEVSGFQGGFAASTPAKMACWTAPSRS